uniref:PDZ domain-containing protein n=1 Tax=Astyanax mexicanus TaxID=7994 RepID=A0A8B9GTL7_ASTMX
MHYTIPFSRVLLHAIVPNKLGWPEEFGFKLGGDGPSYILSVVEGSSAYMAGLQPGDQVLEIDGQNVSSLIRVMFMRVFRLARILPINHSSRNVYLFKVSLILPN